MVNIYLVEKRGSRRYRRDEVLHTLRPSQHEQAAASSGCVSTVLDTEVERSAPFLVSTVYLVRYIIIVEGCKRILQVGQSKVSAFSEVRVLGSQLSQL